MTRERMRWYVDIQDTVYYDDGRIHTQPPTIHDDADYARQQGLPGIIADGMISTNWIMSLLIDVFGEGILERGAVRTKYIAPVYEDQALVTCARVTHVWEDPTGETVHELDVWCEDDAGRKYTVGDATIVTPRPAQRCAIAPDRGQQPAVSTHYVGPPA
jgi:acyl dehydratase